MIEASELHVVAYCTVLLQYTLEQILYMSTGRARRADIHRDHPMRIVAD